MILDLKDVIDRERAGVGVFLTLTEPTKPMIAEAASAGLPSEQPVAALVLLDNLVRDHRRGATDDQRRAARQRQHQKRRHQLQTRIPHPRLSLFFRWFPDS